MDLLSEAITLANLPYTVFLGLIVLFWASVILGALDIDTFDIDFDMDADMDMDMEVDGGVDAAATANFWSWLNLGAVPFSLWLSIFGILAWFQSMAYNAVLNEFGFTFLTGAFRLLGLAFAILPFSMVLTKYLVVPSSSRI